ncbi:MAG: segregation and condensation protein A [Nitrospinales bacterium]
MTYQFKLDIFEGPLDLLLHLIKEQKMDIHDIPIVEITKQYIEYLDMMSVMNLELAGEYLVMAAELTRIKSRVLLPSDSFETEKETEKDPRAELLARLLEYQRYKNASNELRKLEIERQQVFPSGGTPMLDDVAEGEVLVSATVFDLFSAFKSVLEKKTFEKDYEVEITTLSVAERIKVVLEVLNAAETVTFESLFTVLNSKSEVIVTFLAILEMMKLRLIRVMQTETFETIRVYLNADKDYQDEVMNKYDDSDNPK